jgi:microcystin-dependent protein
MADPFVAEIRICGFNFAPKGWAQCNGQMLPIAQNTALFALLGTTYGGDGKSTFALPDLRGAAPLGVGQGPGLSLYDAGQTGGHSAVALDASHMPPHSHQLTGTSTPALNHAPDGTELLGAATVRTYGAPQSLVAMRATSASGGAPHENRQPYLVMNFVIALQGVFPAHN